MKTIIIGDEDKITQQELQEKFKEYEVLATTGNGEELITLIK